MIAAMETTIGDKKIVFALLGTGIAVQSKSVSVIGETFLTPVASLSGDEVRAVVDILQALGFVPSTPAGSDNPPIIPDYDAKRS